MRWASYGFRWVRPLHSIIFVFDGKPIVATFMLGNFDQQTGLPCTPFNASDNTLRCLPSAESGTLANEDATCSGTAQVVLGECYGAAPVDGPSYTSCTDTGYKVHTLTTTVAAASSDFDGTCTPVDLPGGIGYQSGVVGGEISPTTFPALTETIE